MFTQKDRTSSSYNKFQKNVSRYKSLILFFDFLLILLLINSVQAAPSYSFAISSNGKIEYLTPAQTPKPFSTNLAAIPNDWYDATVDLWKYPYISVVTEDGRTAIRLDVDNTERVSRECNLGWFTVKPGDHVVFGIWAKTDSHANTVQDSGARIGLDLFGVYMQGQQQVMHVDSLPRDYTYIDGEWYSGNSWGPWFADYANPVDGAWPDCDMSNGGIIPISQFSIPWGTDWTYIYWDFVVPDEWFRFTDYPSHPDTQLMMIGPWIDARTISDTAYAYFADAELYINP